MEGVIVENTNNNNEKNGLSIMDILKMLKKNIWWILGITIGGSLIALLYVMTSISPSYSAKTSVLVDPSKYYSSSQSSDVVGGLRVSETVEKFITEDAVIKATIKKLVEDGVFEEGTVSVSGFKSHVSTSSTTTNLFIYVTFTSKNKELPITCVNTLVQVAYEMSNEKVTNDSGKEVYKYMGVGNSFNLVSDAEKITTSQKSKKLYLAVGILASLALACAFVVLKEMLRQKIDSVEMIENNIQLPVIGVQIDDKKNQNNLSVDDQEFVNKINYEKLLTNIDFSVVDKSMNVIEITSIDQAQGKTTTISNIAKIMSANSRKVLLIDLDLRKPSLHKTFKLERKNGVAEFASSDIEANINHIDEYIDVITAGANVPNPTVILQSEKLAKLIEESKDKYDYILLDCPPIYASSDAKIITKLSNNQILVVQANKTRVSQVKRALRELDSNSSNIIGVNLTHMKLSKSQYKYYTDYYKSND